MDDQHGILMDTMNDLRLATMRGERTGELLDQLIGFSRLHFASEEQLMEHYAFPGLKEHRADHQRLLARLHESAQRMKHGDPVVLRPLFEFFRDWFIEHIGAFDRL